MSGFVGGDKHLVFSTYLLYPLVYRLILNQCETLEMQNIGWMGVPIEFSYMVVDHLDNHVVNHIMFSGRATLYSCLVLHCRPRLPTWNPAYDDINVMWTQQAWPAEGQM
ncbi:hypothetical protein VTN96DRAFT_1523 [Rasamsonia emersonii]